MLVFFVLDAWSCERHGESRSRSPRILLSLDGSQSTKGKAAMLVIRRMLSREI
jgi:hypothetical protein